MIPASVRKTGIWRGSRFSEICNLQVAELQFANPFAVHLPATVSKRGKCPDLAGRPIAQAPGTPFAGGNHAVPSAW